MAISGSRSWSSRENEYRNLKQITQHRLLHEMLASVKQTELMKILVVDEVTLRIMGSTFKMSDIVNDEVGVYLIENLHMKREPLGADAIYFIQPSRESVDILLSDVTAPMYKKTHVFFSSPLTKDMKAHIKDSVGLRLSALREMNLEYFVIDSQGFITDNERVLEDLIGDNMESSHHYDPCVNLMATRIASVFASLRELPCIRYRAAKSLDASTVTTLLDFVPTKLAASVWNHLTNYKSSIPSFSQTETCELLILDRSVDEIAPVIHEWTYDCMCHDLLNMDGNIYDQEDPSKIGCTFEKKQVLLDDHDPVWLELRHMHIADVSERLYEKMTNFISKNKAAQMQDCSSKISTRNLKRIVQALPQYSDQIERLSRHILIAEKIYKSIKELGLREYGQLEEDLVFGDAGIKDLTNFLMTKQDTTSECKLRLLMIYAAIFPENFEGEEGLKLMKLASLSPEDIKAVNNMRFLKGSSNTKKTSAVGFSLKFGVQEKKPAARNYRGGKEDTWQLTRFCPKIEDLVEKLCKGELSQSDYPCVNDPSPSVHGTGGSLVPVVHSMRSRRTATWAHSRIYDDAYASDSILKHASRMSRRIFVFIIGGATRSELRVCHKLTEKMNREIVLGSTSLDDPQIFIKKLKVAGETSVIKEFPTDIDPSLRISSNSDPTPVENVETKKRRKRLMKLVNTLKSKLKHQSLI